MSEVIEYIQIIITTVIVPLFLYIVKIEKKLTAIETTLCFLKKEMARLNR